jgi:PAS domain S-box-containing protein
MAERLMKGAEPQERYLRTEGFAVLQHICATAGQTREMAKVLDVAVDVLAQMPGVHASCIYLRNGGDWALAACRDSASIVPPASWLSDPGNLNLEDLVANRRAVVRRAPSGVVSADSEAAQSWAAAPCTARGEVRAVAWVGSCDTQGLPLGIGELMEAVASILAMALERADADGQLDSAQEQLSQASRELATMSAIAASVSGAASLDALLADALDKILSVMQLPAGWVFVREGDAENLVLASEQGLSARFALQEATLPLGACICREVLRTGRTAVVDDMSHCPRLSPAVVQSEGLRVHVSVPLKSKDSVLGVMNLAADDIRYFTPRRLEQLNAIGQEIGVAIENVRTLQLTRRERATLTSVMDSMVDGLILVDTGGKISYWNPRASEFLGIPAAAALGRPAMGIARRIAMGSTDPERVSGQLADALLHFQSFPVIEYQLLRPRARAVQSLLFPIGGNSGEDLGFGITLRDVSREKELDEMKLQLLSTVSHELRTPLSSIKGFTTSLLREDVTWDEKTQRDFLQIIDAESDRLSELISNLLDMSRIDAGTLAMETEEIRLGTLLREAIEAAKPQAPKHVFNLEIPARLPMLSADPRRIRQVLRNLLENAVKYSPRGGAVAVAARYDIESVTVSVADEGMGISPEYQERVFERFFQVDSASTRRVGGSGLGLAISRSIVEAHGGRVWVESEPGEGSTFFFTLPRGRRT